ncbi:MAG: RNA polymerase sigma factor [Actinomycetota bacterium]
MTIDDAQLVRRCLGGEPAAFDAIYDRHERRVVGLLRRLTGNEAEALDLAQETFLTAYRTLGSWRGEGAFSTWLCGIAARISANARRRALQHETEPLDDECLLPDTFSDPLAHCTRREAEHRIEGAIAALPRLSREAFVLVKIEGLSYRDAAEALGVPLGTLQSRLWRAVCLLQAALPDLAGPEREDRGSVATAGVAAVDPTPVAATPRQK